MHPDLPSLDFQLLQQPNIARLAAPLVSSHPARILMLYGSLRERSFSRLATEEAARILQALGAEV
ncbi:hypothetical protein Q0N58_14615, partial [Staphylococcus aureus]|nr:hypothetical protein [Staphylococcus aureus]